jgi:archaellum component FlaC
LTVEMQMELRKEALEQTTALETMRVEVKDLRGGLGGDLEGLEASIKDLYSVVEEEVQTRQQDMGEMRDGLREVSIYY